MRLDKAEGRAFDQITALARLNPGPELALTECALALGGGPMRGASSVVAINRADMTLAWSFSNAPAFDRHVWRYFERLGRIEKIRSAAARAIEFAARMPILSTSDFPEITRRTTIYRELMVPCGVEHILRILVPAPGPLLYSFAFGRPRKAPAFNVRDKAFAAHILPLLGQAASSNGSMDETAAMAGGEEAFLLFGRADTEADATPGADQLLRLAGGGHAGGWQTGLETAAALVPDGGARELRNAFGAFAFRAQALGEPAQRTVVAVQRLIPVKVQALRRAAALDLPLRQMELAVRLAGGATLDAAASELSLSLNTARNYVRLIYARLGLDSREGLARALTSADGAARQA